MSNQMYRLTAQRQRLDDAITAELRRLSPSITRLLRLRKLQEATRNRLLKTITGSMQPA